MTETSKKIRLEAKVWRGHVTAAGLLFDPCDLGLDEVKRRILSLWEVGCELDRFGSSLVLRFAQPRELDCARALGSPLVALSVPRGGTVLANGPLPAEWLLDLRAAGLARFVGGSLQMDSFASAEREDPASWLDLNTWTAPPMSDLAPPPPPIEISVVSAPAETRTILGDKIPAPSAKTRAQWDELAREAQGAQGKPAAWRSWLSRFLLAPQPQSAGSATAGPPRDPKWRRLATRLAVWSGLFRLAAGKHGKYFGELMDLLERGQTAEALARAIPLDSKPSSGPPSLPAWGLPSPRSSLDLSLRHVPAARSFGMADEYYFRLRQLYRETAERLIQQGEIEQAVFVLAELLQSEAEAVALLERHGRLRLAAELAEGRELAPDLVVRQWFLAGDVRRALAIARRTGSFQSAIQRLETGPFPKPQEAEKLRLLWGDVLAESGDYLGAVRAVKGISSARAVAIRWIDLGLAVDGPDAGTLLALRLDLAPETQDETAQLVEALLADPSPQREAERLAFAASFANLSGAPRHAGLARKTARALLVERHRQGRVVDGQALDYAQRLAQNARDPVFAEDLRRAPRTIAGRTSLLPAEEKNFAAPWETLAGTRPLQQAAWLPGGRWLLALGDDGALLVDARGRTLAHFDVPAHRLVVADAGTRAIAVGHRGEARQLSRLDLGTRQAEPWFVGPLDAFANSYDGSGWFVVRDRALWLVDALPPRGAAARPFEALWHIPDLPGTVLALQRTSTSLALLLKVQGPKNPDGFQVWRLTLPDLTLRARDSVFEQKKTAIALKAAIAPNGLAALISVPFDDPSEDPALTIELAGNHKATRPCLEFSELALTAQNCFLSKKTAEGIAVNCLETIGTRPRELLALPGAEQCTLRLDDRALTIADDRGRAIALDPKELTRLGSLRV